MPSPPGATPTESSVILRALQPYAWLAALAFLVGFLGYFGLSGPEPAPAEGLSWSAPASAPVSDDWNAPKHI